MDWERVKAVLDEALELPAGERASFVEAKCADDARVRREVMALLDVGEAATGFLDAPEIEAKPVAGASSTHGAGDTIGRYKLLQRIGEGGFGVVYMAEQERPVRRRVALKLLKPGVDTKQVLARFEAERQALALMDHPNIARVFDAGETENGRPYFVMELVAGDPITTYCDRENLSTVERLGLFREACAAVQHAHQKGVIHRDIKPSNVLVGTIDGKPVPKVIDFGVAKATNVALTDRTLFTEFRQLIGTPAYMSPEQADTSSLADVDTRSDVYSLGVLLYELLTGSPPFTPQTLREAGFAEMLRIIRESEPEKPSTRISTLGDGLDEVAKRRQEQPGKLGTLVRGELDWIVMKALEKDRGRRYDSPASFALDLERYLANEPVSASPPSALYKARKFVRRNRAAVASTAVVLLALVLGVIGTSGGFVWALNERAVAREAEGRAVENEATARRSATEVLLLSAGQEKRLGNYIEAARLLDRVDEPSRTHWWNVARAMASTRSELMASGRVRYRWNADHSLIAATRVLGGLDIRDGETFEIIANLERDDIARPKWTSDPNAIVLMGGGFRLHDGRTLEPIGPKVEWTSPRNPGVVGDRFVVAQSPEGEDLRLQVIDLIQGEVVTDRRFPGLARLVSPPIPAGNDWFWFHRSDGPVFISRVPDLSGPVLIDERTPKVARPYSPDQGVVFRRAGSSVECWWINDAGEPAYGWTYTVDTSINTAHARDGIALLHAQRRMHLVDVATGEPLVDPIDMGTSSRVADVDWERGRLLVDLGRAQTRLFELDAWKSPYSAQVAKTSARQLRFTPDHRIAIAANFDAHYLFEGGGVRLVDPIACVEIGRLLGPRWHGQAVPSPDGTTLVTESRLAKHGGRGAQDVRVLSLETGAKLWSGAFPHPTNLRYTPDGTGIIIGQQVYSARSGEVVSTAPAIAGFVGHRTQKYELREPGTPNRPWFDVIDRATSERVRRFEADVAFRRHARISNDGTRVILWETTSPVTVFDIKTGALLAMLPDYTTDTMVVAWSPDDRLIATASTAQSSVIRVWDADTLELLGALAGHRGYIEAMEFSADGRSLSTAGQDGTFRVWNDRTPWEQAAFVAARRAIYDRLRPTIEGFAERSVEPDAADAWSSFEALGLEGEDRDVGELLMLGALLTRFGS
ncbi:MAG: serine/threonine-protein kinase [Planctomycetota bacterium]